MTIGICWHDESGLFVKLVFSLYNESPGVGSAAGAIGIASRELRCWIRNWPTSNRVFYPSVERGSWYRIGYAGSEHFSADFSRTGHVGEVCSMFPGAGDRQERPIAWGHSNNRLSDLELVVAMTRQLPRNPPRLALGERPKQLAASA